MNILIDTGVWFRWYHQLPLADRLIEFLNGDHTFFLSAISVWEIANKQRRGRLPGVSTMQDWLPEALSDYEI